MLQPAVAFRLMAVSMIMVEVKEAERKELELLGSRAGRVLRLAVWIGLRRVESSRRDGASAKYLAQVHPPVAVHPCMAVCMIAVDVKKEAGRKELELLGQSSGARAAVGGSEWLQKGGEQAT